MTILFPNNCLFMFHQTSTLISITKFTKNISSTYLGKLISWTVSKTFRFLLCQWHKTVYLQCVPSLYIFQALRVHQMWIAWVQQLMEPTMEATLAQPRQGKSARFFYPPTLKAHFYRTEVNMNQIYGSIWCCVQLMSLCLMKMPTQCHLIK